MAMTWSYKVVRHRDLRGDYYYMIHEYYKMEDEQCEKYSMLSDTGCNIIGDDIDELRSALTRMLSCLDEPVIDYEKEPRRDDPSPPHLPS